MPAPTVTQILPSSGPTAGGTPVTITGTNFVSGATVTIGGTSATSVVVVNSTTITCTTAGHSAGVASVLVTVSGQGTNAANDYFTYAAAPTVSSIAPLIGSVTGGAMVTITGTNFIGVTGVTIGGAAATNVTVVSQTRLTCTTPARSAGTASALVTAAGGTNGANSLFIYVVPAPTDTYIYLKGGRGDGFVPLWTGDFFDEERHEQGEPYRNIFQSTAQTNFKGTYGIEGGGSITVPALMTEMNDTMSPTAGYGLEGKVTYVAPHISDEAMGLEPHQFNKTVTWRGYTSANGVVYHFRLADVLGTGSQPRSE